MHKRRIYGTIGLKACADPMTTPLSLFLSRQLELRGLTPDEFARMSGLVRSHVYFILDGKRVNVRTDTIDKIAAALGMTPAEMLVSMGKGTNELATDEAEHLAAYRRLPPERKPTATEIISALGVPPAQRRAIGRQDAAAKRLKATDRKLGGRRAKGDDEGSSGPLAVGFHAVTSVAAPWRTARATAMGTL